MSSYVKLPPKFKYLGIPASAAVQVRSTPDHMGARLGGTAVLLSGEDAGKPVIDVKLNQLIKITPSMPINAGKYTLHVGFNPALAELGAVSCNPFVSDGAEISLVLKAYKNFSLTDLDYVFNLYVID
jgi:hypothetical protein